MPYRPRVGETEFGGVGGMYPPEQRAAPSLQQEMWAIYATNEGGGPDLEGRDPASIAWALDNIGEPRESFSIGAPEPDLTAVAPWNGEEEGE